jgi:ABC-type phosphate transport system substrate-binding protein
LLEYVKSTPNSIGYVPASFDIPKELTVVFDSQ